jgi:FlaA1/EpsC-like NDP-sugar epimerase
MSWYHNPKRYIIMMDIQSYIIWLRENMLIMMSEFLTNINSYLIFWWIIYLLCILWLYARMYYANKTYAKIDSLFRLSIDTLYYEISVLLYNHRQDIHEFDTNIPLLLSHKTNLINQRDKAHYYEHFESCLKR